MCLSESGVRLDTLPAQQDKYSAMNSRLAHNLPVELLSEVSIFIRGNAFRLILTSTTTSVNRVREISILYCTGPLH